MRNYVRLLNQLSTKLLITASLAVVLSQPASAKVEPADAATVAQWQQEFIETMVNEHGFSTSQVQQLLQQASFNQDVFDAIQRPWEAKPWHQYYPIFLTEKRLQAGLKFWQTHQQTLAKAEQEYGVPAEIIVAIIGVETFYGEYLGNYSVLDSLFTLGFHYPPRAKFFRSELAQFMLLANEEGLPATELMGSYAGAMGYGQFISSSYRHYAVDFDADGVRDLLGNPVDAIGSVAHYFARHGWQADAPVAQLLAPSDSVANLVEKGLKPSATVAELTERGLSLTSTVNADLKAKVFAFELAEGHEYWLGFNNFYVITRYNHSPLYAMAVYQFSQQLRQAR